MKRGVVERDEDISGVTGTGSVAEFSIATDGRLAIFWPTGVGVWPSLEEAIKVHGHNGKTRFIILDDPDAPDVPHCLDCHMDSIQDYRNRNQCTKHNECPTCLTEAG